MNHTKAVVAPRSLPFRFVEAFGKDAGEWRRQANEAEDSGASAQEASFPKEPSPASVDDEVNMEMEVEGSVKSQAEQAVEASRRRQREQLEAAPGDLQMRIMMEESHQTRESGNVGECRPDREES